jgi:hypothetical protein
MHISFIVDECVLVAQVPRGTEEEIITSRASCIEDIV